MVLVVEAVARITLHEVEHVGGGGEHLARAEHRLTGLGALEGEAEDLFEAVELRYRPEDGEVRVLTDAGTRAIRVP